MFAVDEDLPRVGSDLEGRAVLDDEVGVGADVERADPVVDAEDFGGGAGHRFDRDLGGEALADREADTHI